jgi:hypothetical protein
MLADDWIITEFANERCAMECGAFNDCWRCFSLLTYSLFTIREPRPPRSIQSVSQIVSKELKAEIIKRRGGAESAGFVSENIQSHRF